MFNLNYKKVFMLLNFKISKLAFFVLFFVLFSFPFLTFSATIISTEVGGNWTENSTWIGGVVPVETDDVIINGNVKLSTAQYQTHTKKINSVEVMGGGNLETTNLSYRSVIFEINENLKNSGTIHEKVNIFLGKDLEN
ncbi:MAG: hypothetical protein KAI16_01550, partial [Candidatus Pacebacteria bacterium]|nr:hypothetical protein [Candidatus Paceibacterota bacterium]